MANSTVFLMQVLVLVFVLAVIGQTVGGAV